MTTRQIVALFHGKRAGRGRYMARCPVHGQDRTPSLSIAEGRDGKTLIRCWAGCEAEAVLGAVGLRISDLFPDSKPDREALALAEKERARVDREQKELRRQAREAIDRARKWESVRNALGFLLMQRPEDSKLNALFTHSINMTRELPPTGRVDSYIFQPGDVFPHHHPLDGITAQDVGRQVAKILKLPMGGE